MSLYIQFLSVNFEQTYNQNARFGIFIFKIFRRKPPSLPPYIAEGLNPYHTYPLLFASRLCQLEPSVDNKFKGKASKN
jgi:hypothetical protein